MRKAIKAICKETGTTIEWHGSLENLAQHTCHVPGKGECNYVPIEEVEDDDVDAEFDDEEVDDEEGDE